MLLLLSLLWPRPKPNVERAREEKVERTAKQDDDLEKMKEAMAEMQAQMERPRNQQEISKIREIQI